MGAVCPLNHHSRGSAKHASSQSSAGQGLTRPCIVLKAQARADLVNLSYVAFVALAAISLLFVCLNELNARY